MNGNKKLLIFLNSLLAYKLTALSQYIVHSEICKYYGYNEIHLAIREKALSEMHHVKWLIERILFFNSSQTEFKFDTIKIGKNVSEIFGNYIGKEAEVINSYNDNDKIAREVEDQGKIDMLTRILNIEEDHIIWKDQQPPQIEQIDIKNYPVNQN
jgi:bacterioferritin